nr:hypothetical protein [Pseudonocardia acidicola]
MVELGGTPGSSEVVAAVAVPAQSPAPPPGKGEEFGESSPIALVVIVLLGLATVLLIRSMTKHLRKVPTSFDQQGDAAEPGAPTEPGTDTDPGTGNAGSSKG